MNAPRLSLCMILKDEEKGLPGCLASVKGWVDEIIVVDTGSSDRTVEIALQQGARVFHHSWEGDFSKHQNQSVDYAAGDWVLQMDGDEALQEGSGPLIRQAILDADADSFYMTVLSFFNQGASSSWESKIRLFRRRANIRYENIVHKQLKGYRRPKVLAATILHYGYDLSPEEQRKKYERTSTLLRRQIAEDPENYWHRHNLAVSLASNSLYSEAVEIGLSALSLAKPQAMELPNILWTSYIVAASCLKLGDLQRAEEIANRAVRRSRDHLDSHFVLVLLYHQMKRWEELEFHGREYLRVHKLMENEPERFTGAIINMAGEAWRVRVALGDSSLQKNHLDNARALFEKAVLETHVRPECLKIIGDCYKNRGRWEDASHYYQKALSEKHDWVEAMLCLALCKRRLGREGDAGGMYTKAIEIAPACVEALVNLGNLLYENGDLEASRPLYERALDAEPRLVQVSLRLANLATLTGDMETCLRCCDSILRALDLSFPKALESLNDLADLFLVIAHALEKAGRQDLFKEAAEAALHLRPDLLTPGDSVPVATQKA